MNTEIEINYTEDYYEVFYIDKRGNRSEIGYGDKDVSFADHAQNFYELAAALNAHIKMEKQG